MSETYPELVSGQEPETVNPEDVLRALLHISPEDAETVREASPATRKRGDKGQEGPTEDDGE